MTGTLLVATRKGLFVLREKAGTWTSAPPAFPGSPVTAVLRDPRDGCLLAALSLGHFGCKLHRSRDDGATWQELQPPAFAAVPEGETGPSLHMIWTLVPGGADQKGLIWAGTLPGGLFRSPDQGDSWELVQSLWDRPEREKWFGGGYDHPGIHSILIDPRDSRKLTLGVSCGGVWKSDDGGAEWRQAGQGLRSDYMPGEQAYDPVSQDPHLLAACRAHPETIWCQHHNGIFLSRDGAETFSEIREAGPSVFGFGVVAHPEDADTAWFAPAQKDEFRIPVDGKFVFTRTRDGGKSFDVLNRGLPKSQSWDLIYRHALDIAPGGRRLAAGSTTGNLWISDDGGEAWAHVEGHLPPIAQVAFV